MLIMIINDGNDKIMMISSQEQLHGCVTILISAIFMLSSNRPNKKNYEMILDAVSVLYQKKDTYSTHCFKIITAFYDDRCCGLENWCVKFLSSIIIIFLLF